MIHRIRVGQYQCNCYIVEVCDKEVIAIDPGANGKKIQNYLKENELHLKAIFLTHGHCDHIGAVDYLVNLYHCPVYLHQEDMVYIKDLSLNEFLLKEKMPISSKISKAPEKIKIGDKEFKWIHLPGHTPGSCAILLEKENTLFTGDVLFAGSIGRYDLPLGSVNDTRHTIEKLKTFNPSWTIYPGHEETSTMDNELKTNPYLNS